MPPKTTKKIAHLNANKSKDSNLTTSDSESDGAPLTKRGKSRSQPKSDLDTPPKRRGPGRPRHSKSIVVDSDESMKDNDEEPAESSKAPNKRKRQATKPSMEGKAVAQSSDDEMPDVHGETISDSNADYDSVEWTEEDQILLDFTHDYEISLWRRTKSIFNCAPFDLFPKGIKAANDDWSGYDYNGQFIKNETSLTIPLCKSLCTLVCFPFFDGDIEFVRYALSTALRSRCGDRPPLEMEGYDVWVAFEAEFDTLSKNLKTFGLFLDDSQLGKLKDALEYHPSLLRLSKEYKL